MLCRSHPSHIPAARRPAISANHVPATRHPPSRSRSVNLARLENPMHVLVADSRTAWDVSIQCITARARLLDVLVRVEQALWVEHLLDAAHHVD
jgi:hypothetical protein